MFMLEDCHAFADDRIGMIMTHVPNLTLLVG